MVFDSGSHALLVANTAEWGWVEIALLENVDAYQLGQMIQNGTLIDDGGALQFG